MENLEKPENLTNPKDANNPKTVEKPEKDGLPQSNSTKSQNSRTEERAAENGQQNLETSNREDIGSKPTPPNYREHDNRKTG